jgi:hypothetical protein
MVALIPDPAAFTARRKHRIVGPTKRVHVEPRRTPIGPEEECLRGPAS